MAIKKENKTVYTCSDGTCFDSKNRAKDYEFDYLYGNIASVIRSPDGDEIHPSIVRRWLDSNRNPVLDYIGTLRDPEEG